MVVNGDWVSGRAVRTGVVETRIGIEDGGQASSGCGQMTLTRVSRAVEEAMQVVDETSIEISANKQEGGGDGGGREGGSSEDGQGRREGGRNGINLQVKKA